MAPARPRCIECDLFPLPIHRLRNRLAGVWSFCHRALLFLCAQGTGKEYSVVYGRPDSLCLARPICPPDGRAAGDSARVAPDRLLVWNLRVDSALVLPALLQTDQ